MVWPLWGQKTGASSNGFNCLDESVLLDPVIALSSLFKSSPSKPFNLSCRLVSRTFFRSFLNRSPSRICFWVIIVCLFWSLSVIWSIQGSYGLLGSRNNWFDLEEAFWLGLIPLFPGGSKGPMNIVAFFFGPGIPEFSDSLSFNESSIGFSLSSNES